MGSSRKHQIGATSEKSETKKSTTRDTIPVLAPLKSISKKKTEEEENGEFEEQSTTPRSEESRMSEKLVCPAAPRKRRPASTCHFNGAREFFTPPDLESVFIPYVGRAN